MLISTRCEAGGGVKAGQVHHSQVVAEGLLHDGDVQQDVQGDGQGLAWDLLHGPSLKKYIKYKSYMYLVSVNVLI